MEIVGVCCTSATAIEFCKTVTAFFFRINIAALKFITDILTFDTLVHISKQEILISNKLMTRIKVTPRCHCQILCSRTTAGKTFCHARSTLQIYHKMEEIEIISIFMSLYHLSSQLVIFLIKLWKVFLTDRIILGRLCHYRFY